LLERLAENPLLRPEDVPPTRADLEVYCTLNPAAVQVGDETILLVRVGERPAEQAGRDIAVCVYDASDGQVKIVRIPRDDPQLDATDPRKIMYRGRLLLTSLSHLRVARSGDGRNFTFDPAPAIFPSSPYETFGCEDARITRMGDEYLITYTSVSERGVTVSLATTRDFVSFDKRGVIFPPYQKDVCIFPDKIRGLYVGRHRPFKSEFNPASIWTAYSPDLLSWGRHEMTLAPAPGTWSAGRVGCGAPPIRTDEGWLEIFHAADADGRYCLGAMLSELDHPERCICHSARPVFEPKADYELAGVYGNCVFSNGMVARPDGTLVVYYGAADRICAAAVTTVDEMVAAARS